MRRPLTLLATFVHLAGGGDDDATMDLTDGGSLPREETLTDCMNGADDDLDGNTDCEDFSCVGYDHCRMPPPPPDDGGPRPPRPDGGPRPPRRDSGPDEDAGTPEEDAGTTDEDSGTPFEDAGMMELDADLPEEDAGLPLVDAGFPGFPEGGLPGLDAGL